jgi:hypothetical protein
MAFLNPPSAPLFKRGERGNFCRCLAQKSDVEKYGGFFQKAKVLQKKHSEIRNPNSEIYWPT